PAIAFYQNVLALQWAVGETDPQQLTSGKPLVYGFVDGIDVSGPGRIKLKGWMASTTGPVPESLMIRLNGKAYPAEQMTRVKRADVVKRFGVADGQCGFHADFRIPAVNTLVDLRDMIVSGGLTDADTTLRQSDRVSYAIRTGQVE